MRLGPGVTWCFVGGGPGVCDRADGVWDLRRGGAGIGALAGGAGVWVLARGGVGVCDREGDVGVEGRDNMEADLTCIGLNRDRGVDVGLYWRRSALAGVYGHAQRDLESVTLHPCRLIIL